MTERLTGKVKWFDPKKALDLSRLKDRIILFIFAIFRQLDSEHFQKVRK